MQGVKDRIDSVYRKLRTGQYETPQTLKDDFSDVRRLLSQYREGELLVEYLKEIRANANLPRAREDYWLRQFEFLEKSLQNLNPDASSFQEWKTTVEAAKVTLEEDIVNAVKEQDKSVTRGIAGRSSGEVLSQVQPLPPGPSISAVFRPKQVAQADRNLRWFNWISRIVAIALLAWLGMTELYGSNATFGANPMRDYFAVMAWGFGAELTRESVLRATQDLGLPLTK
ncbi:MAG: hypothetical protein WBG32_19110 [Nodosilinea sp.]